MDFEDCSELRGGLKKLWNFPFSIYVDFFFLLELCFVLKFICFWLSYHIESYNVLTWEVWYFFEFQILEYKLIRCWLCVCNVTCIHPPTYMFLTKYEYILRGSEYLVKNINLLLLCANPMDCQINFSPKFVKSTNLCFIWNKNQC